MSMSKCPSCNKCVPTCIIKYNKCEWCLSKEVRMKWRQDEVDKIIETFKANIITSGFDYPTIYGLAEHLVDNGIRSKGGFELKYDVRENARIEPKEYKDE